MIRLLLIAVSFSSAHAAPADCARRLFSQLVPALVLSATPATAQENLRDYTCVTSRAADPNATIIVSGSLRIGEKFKPVGDLTMTGMGLPGVLKRLLLAKGQAPTTYVFPEEDVHIRYDKETRRLQIVARGGTSKVVVDYGFESRRSMYVNVNGPDDLHLEIDNPTRCHFE